MVYIPPAMEEVYVDIISGVETVSHAGTLSDKSSECPVNWIQGIWAAGQEWWK